MKDVMNERDKRILAILKGRIAARTGDKVQKLIVFGSRCRGDANEDSDLDVLALVKERTLRLEDELDDIAYSVMWEFDFRPIISLKVMSEHEFMSALNKGYSFYCNVMREGVAV